jgi:hypothetical protein
MIIGQVMRGLGVIENVLKSVDGSKSEAGVLQPNYAVTFFP